MGLLIRVLSAGTLLRVLKRYVRQLVFNVYVLYFTTKVCFFGIYIKLLKAYNSIVEIRK